MRSLIMIRFGQFTAYSLSLLIEDRLRLLRGFELPELDMLTEDEDRWRAERRERRSRYFDREHEREKFLTGIT